MRVLIVGWPSFLHGEATAGDELAMRAVQDMLTEAGVDCKPVFSHVFQPSARHLEDVEPDHYSHLVFVCGPAVGEQVSYLHRRYAHCHRVAVGVSIVDPNDPAVRGFHRVIPRDEPGGAPHRDISAITPVTAVPVAGVVLAPGQREYGDRRRHDMTHEVLSRWLPEQPWARIALDTRLDATDWRLCQTGAQFCSLVARFDLIITSRLHGLVLALRQGVPALAVDPVDGGAKVAAQAEAWSWPAVITTDRLTSDTLDHWSAWCLSEQGRALAREHAEGARTADGQLAALLRELTGAQGGSRQEMTAHGTGRG